MKNLLLERLTPDRLASLLRDAAMAHHVYERNVLKGVRDEDWPKYYADYILARLRYCSGAVSRS